MIEAFAPLAFGSPGSGIVAPTLVTANFDNTVHLNHDGVKFQPKDPADVHVQQFVYVAPKPARRYSGSRTTRRRAHDRAPLSHSLTARIVCRSSQSCRVAFILPGGPRATCVRATWFTATRRRGF
jgi:hypothetical protein